jgi:hypothetical protein
VYLKQNRDPLLALLPPLRLHLGLGKPAMLRWYRAL